ncbi:MAG: efflux RND transporter periplasmic adaptor subunit [Phycisphaerales bacterium]|nr:efflux RND transporter periplasmic adaptor subunit [Phycisphaerales bacterium]
MSACPTALLPCGFSRLLIASLVALAPAGALGQPRSTPVQVAPIMLRELPATVRLVGSIAPSATAMVAAEVSGVVLRIDADEGAFVRLGDPLVTLDPEPAQHRLEEARGRLGRHEARLQELVAGVRPEVIRRWEATQAEAQAQLRRAEFERERMRDLDQERRANSKELNDAERDHEAALARLQQVEAQLSEARNGARAEELAAARADVAAARAETAGLSRARERTVIRAPFDGFVVVRRTQVGEWLSEGAVAAEFICLETVRVRIDVPQDAVRYCRPGAPASVAIDALGRSENGSIARVIPRASPAARTFPIELDLPNPDRDILPGMTVWAVVPAGPTGPRLMVLKDAIVASGTTKTVYVVRRGETGDMAFPVPVETGIELSDEIEIRGAGLAAGEPVVCRANERLHGPTPVMASPLPNSATPKSPPASTAGSADSAAAGSRP